MTKQNLIERLELIQPARFMGYGLKEIEYTNFYDRRISGLVDIELFFSIFNLIIKEINRKKLVTNGLEKLLKEFDIREAISEKYHASNVYDSGLYLKTTYGTTGIPHKNDFGYSYSYNKNIILCLINLHLSSSTPFAKLIYKTDFEEPSRISYGKFDQPMSDRSFP